MRSKRTKSRFASRLCKYRSENCLGAFQPTGAAQKYCVPCQTPALREKVRVAKAVVLFKANPDSFPDPRLTALVVDLLQQEPLSLLEVAERLGIPRYEVEKALSRNKKSFPTLVRYANVPVEKIVELRKQKSADGKNLSIAVIAEKLNIGPSVVERILVREKAMWPPDLTPEQIVECDLDRAWEARNGIVDRVICRECFRFYAQVDAYHLKRRHLDITLGMPPGTSVMKAYDRKHFGAPHGNLISALKTALNFGRTPPLIEEAIGKLTSKWCSAKELLERRRNRHFEDDQNHEGITNVLVACRECGAKSNNLNAHIQDVRVHGLSAADYHERWPGAPLISKNEHALYAQRAALRRRKATEKASKSKNPAHRPAKKRDLFVEAARLYPSLSSWGKVAMRLTPDEFANDPRGAADRLRLGAKSIEHVLFQSASEKSPN